MIKNTLCCLAFAALSVSPIGPASQLSAQADALDFPAASPQALVREQVGLTTVEIEYARPSCKGRKIFGGLIPYGEVWRTGANEATRIMFSTDISFGGEAVSAGTYALFTIPGKTEWTVILNQVTGQWGSYGYNPAQDVVRVTVDAEKLEQRVETMRLGLAHMRDDSAQLELAWENTRVLLPIKTDLVAMLVPKIEAAMAAPGDRKPYLASAMFYYHHEIDLDKSLQWIDAELAQQPQAVWIQYRKGLILAKLGDKLASMEAAQRALELADAAGGELGAEYRRLSEALLDSLN
jgi:tetratricopeptide (TPR) repeat protein